MKKKHGRVKPCIHKSEKNKKCMLLLIFQIDVTILTIENAEALHQLHPTHARMLLNDN